MSTPDFGILLGLAYQRFVVDLNAHLATKGFTGIKPTFGYVFRAIGPSGRLTTAQLAAQLHITNQGMAKVVDEMTASGYLEKSDDSGDARVKLLSLSPRGLAALRTARAFHASFEDGLGGRKAATIRKLLSEIVSAGGSEDELARTLRPL